jgi:hypothetical protein
VPQQDYSYGHSHPQARRPQYQRQPPRKRPPPPPSSPIRDLNTKESFREYKQ